MKRSRSRSIRMLREQEVEVPVADLFRKHEQSSPTFYNWKARYGGLDVSKTRP